MSLPCSEWKPFTDLLGTCFICISYYLLPCDLNLHLQPGFLEGSGAHVLVLGPVSEGGCGVNHIGGTHELLHILGLAHTQNRPDR